MHRGYFQLYVLSFMHSLVCCEGAAKLLKDANFCKILTFNFHLLLFCTVLECLQLSLIYFFCCRSRSEILVCGIFPGFGSHWMLRDFCECFEKSLYGRNLLLTIQNLFLLLPQDIRFSTNEGLLLLGVLVGVPQMCRRFLKFAYVVVRM